VILDRHTLQVHKPLFYFQSTHLTEEPIIKQNSINKRISENKRMILQHK